LPDKLGLKPTLLTARAKQPIFRAVPSEGYGAEWDPESTWSVLAWCARATMNKFGKHGRTSNRRKQHCSYEDWASNKMRKIAPRSLAGIRGCNRYSGASLIPPDRSSNASKHQCRWWPVSLLVTSLNFLQRTIAATF
jgi:hypothetical protein